MTLADLWSFHLARLSYWEGYEDAMSGRPERSGRQAYKVGYQAGRTDLLKREQQS